MKINVIYSGKHELPQFETAQSAGMDIRANIDAPLTLQPGDYTLIPTGIQMALPDGAAYPRRSRVPERAKPVQTKEPPVQQVREPGPAAPERRNAQNEFPEARSENRSCGQISKTA